LHAPIESIFAAKLACSELDKIPKETARTMPAANPAIAKTTHIFVGSTHPLNLCLAFDHRLSNFGIGY
jgi:hypothetical protein